MLSKSQAASFTSFIFREVAHKAPGAVFSNTFAYSSALGTFPELGFSEPLPDLQYAPHLTL